MMTSKEVTNLIEVISSGLSSEDNNINLTKRDIGKIRRKLDEIEEQIEKQDNLMYVTVSYNPDLTEGRCYYSVITIPISFKTDDEFRREYISKNIANAIENVVLSGKRKYESIMGSIQYMETAKSYVDNEKPNHKTKLLDTLCFENLPESDYDLEKYLEEYLKVQGISC